MKTSVRVPFASNRQQLSLRPHSDKPELKLRIWALLAALALLAFSPSPCVGQTFLFDFGGANTTVNGPSPDDPVNFWNNVTTTVGQSDTGELLNLITTGNAATSVGLKMISRFNGANENGTQASTLYPVDATRDSLYGNTETWSGLANIFPSFKLVGLNLAASYDFKFYASRMSASDNRETGYTLTGANAGFAALNAAANENNFTTALGITPDTSGEIRIDIAPTANNNNAYHFTYLGVLEMTVVPEPSAFALMLGGGLMLGCLRRKNCLG